MKLLTLFVLLCAHSPLLWAFIQALRKQVLPRSIDFISVAFFLYFDLEIAFEALGGHFTNQNFRPFFSANESTLLFAIVAIALGPWIIAAGYFIFPAHRNYPTIFSLRRKAFYWTATLICVAVVFLPVSIALTSSSPWESRAAIGDRMGAMIAILYIPLGVLSFYIQHRKSKTRWGRIYTIILLVFCILATFAIGERTLLLLPVLITAFFGWRLSLKKLSFIGIVLILGAIALLPIFKPNSTENSAFDSLNHVFSGDIARGPVLIESLDSSVLIGTKLLPYPGAGYVYFLLLFVPRSIAPFKGMSQGHALTGHIVNELPEEINWSFGISPIDDAVLNFGWISYPFMLFLYGFAFGAVDRASLSLPVLRVVRLAAIWFVGYGVSTMFLFGPVIVFGLLCHWAFIRVRRAKEINVSLVEHFP